MLGRKTNSKSNKSKEQEAPHLIPKGILLHLKLHQVKPSANNPRRLFDPGPLHDLKESISAHGVLVPITVYKVPGQEKYAIVDGERRYRCCVDLKKEGVELEIPANVVETPDKMASLLYMFNIHSFRQGWELMPSALSLNKVMKNLNVTDNKDLQEITGLSNAQINKCKIILSYPEKFQKLSLDQDPHKRIPSNFWIELYPVLNISEEVILDIVKDLGRDDITERMVNKYRLKKIRSVIHFRRIMESFEISEDNDDKQKVTDRLREFILTENLETREAFDGFIRDKKRFESATQACDKFFKDVERSKIEYSLEGKEALIEKLTEVIKFAQNLIDKLIGEDEPEETEENFEDQNP